ncbi:MAG: polyphosphate kinase 1 [Myxococcales bacterium]
MDPNIIGPGPLAPAGATTAAAPAAALTIVPPPEAAPAPAPVQNLNDAKFFINRELSWLAFNERVLEEGLDPSVPALERLKFLAIASSNLDEFFMIRVAGLKQQLVGHVEESGPDAMSPGDQLAAIATRCHDMVARQYRALLGDVLPNLDRAGVCLLAPAKLSTESDHFLADYFGREIFPVLTPIALDPGHPFPHLRNKSLNLAVRFAAPAPGARLRYGVVPVPSVLPRLVEVPDGKRTYFLLEDVIARHVAQLFPGMPVEGCWAFRVIRNWDLSIDEEEAEDLLVTIEREVRRRDRGSAVRLEIAAQAEQHLSDYLVRALKLGAPDVYRIDGPLNVPDLLPLLGRIDHKELHDEPFTPVSPPAVGDGERDFFRLIREKDVLLHHPYESFDPVVSFIEAAADDPAVLAIKMTLYRTGKDSPVVRALQRVAENGKQVTALVELKARMDEEANILWARALEQAGVHVVYGLIGYKTHCKVALIVRREAGGLRRYVHLGTGNYNPTTARIYSDLSLFTARDDFGSDASSIFNLLTGYSKPTQWKKFKVAPLGMKAAVMEMIDREAELARQNGRGRIIAKMNSLADSEVIKALYRASKAGVQVDLIVRGICCLRPGLPGVSARIRVISVVDRFLEHSRIWFFEAGGKRELWLSSADWMPRNFIRRVELAFPIEDPSLKDRIVDEVLGTPLLDNTKARFLHPDGHYERILPGSYGTPMTLLRSQERLMTVARRAGAAMEQPPVAGAEIFPSTERRPARRRRKRL